MYVTVLSPTVIEPGLVLSTESVTSPPFTASLFECPTTIYGEELRGLKHVLGSRRPVDRFSFLDCLDDFDIPDGHGFDFKWILVKNHEVR